MSDAIHIGVPIGHLRPTQMTVGLREVARKREQWRAADGNGRARLLRRHVLPAVIGPRGRPYITDHHHFARALLEEDAGPVAVYVLDDLEHLSKHEFWTFLDNSGWCHSYDDHGKRRGLEDMPKRLGDLADDPFRSLAGELIRAGSCAKSGHPYAEFLWADHLRHRMEREQIEDNWDRAVRHALKLARGADARCLPGWCGENPAGL